MKIHTHFIINAVLILCLSLTPALNTYAAETTKLTLTYDGKTHSYNELAIKLVINGNEINGLSMPPIVINDYTFVPAREVFEPLGAEIKWNPDLQEVTVIMGSSTAVLTINNTNATVNGIKKEMPVPPKIINDKTMIPLRFVADNMNLLVYWENASRTVYIDDLGIYYNQESQTYDESVLADYGYIVNTQNDDIQSVSMDVSINRNTSMSESDTVIPARDKSSSKITDENHPDTSITKIIRPQDGKNYFMITAESAISKVEKNLLADNRMYLDIYGAVLNVSQSAYSFTDNPNVASVRAAQNQIDPEKIVRVVFDLKDGTEYFIDLSADRKTITVGFERNIIKDYIFTTSNGADTFTIVGASTPSVTIYPMENPDRLVIEAPYADMNKIENEVSFAGEFIYSINSMQYDENTARIVLNLRKKAGYNLSTEDNKAVISLYSPTHKNLDYDYANKRIILNKSTNQSLNIQGFIHTDNYSSFQYIITIPGDYSGHFGQGEHIIRDSYINSVNVTTTGGATSIIIDEARILAYNVYEDASSIYIQPVLPKEKYSKIVVIDPGHGGDAPGTSGYGLVERDVNLDIALRLHELLEKDGRVKVYSTRLTDINPSFEERAQFGTENGDLFVSIHNNYAEIRNGVPNPVPNGTETYYYPHSNDANIGFSSEQAAEIFQGNMVSVLGSADRGTKTNNYLVLVYSKVPAILCEVGFFSNQDEAMKLATGEYRQKAAQGLFEGILSIFNNYSPKR